jgi:hypothetical protein
MVVNFFHAKGFLMIGCYLSQVSNPSIQFMLYETLLAKLKKGRAGNSVTAIEVFSHFTRIFSIMLVLIFLQHCHTKDFFV